MTRVLLFIACLLLAGMTFTEVQQQDEFDLRYWKLELSSKEIVASDSLLDLFIVAPEQFEWETGKVGTPLMVIGSIRKFVDEYGRGWLLECVGTWDATSEYLKKNGKGTTTNRFWSQVTTATLIFEPRPDVKQKK